MHDKKHYLAFSIPCWQGIVKGKVKLLEALDAIVAAGKGTRYDEAHYS